MSDKQSYDGITYREEQQTPLVFRLLLGGLVVWAVLFMAYFLFSGWSSEQEFKASKQAKTARTAGAGAADALKPREIPQEIEKYRTIGAAVYGEKCASCHGPAGKGGIGPDLARSAYAYGKGEKEIYESIANGRPKGMPGFKNELDSQKIEGLVYYLLNLK